MEVDSGGKFSLDGKVCIQCVSNRLYEYRYLLDRLAYCRVDYQTIGSIIRLSGQLLSDYKTIFGPTIMIMMCVPRRGIFSRLATPSPL